MRSVSEIRIVADISSSKKDQQTGCNREYREYDIEGR